jgi:hypothetical protein
MRKAEVEIHSDAVNMAVMRHPDRSYPGILIQGDTLLGLCEAVTKVAALAKDALPREAFRELEFVREDLQDLLDHYSDVSGYPGLGPRPERNLEKD